MALPLQFGAYIPLALLLEDRDETKYVRATLRDEVGDELAGSPYNVPHKAYGFYQNGSSATMPNKPSITVEYDVFDDAAFTTPSGTHYPTAERIYLYEGDGSQGGGAEGDVIAVIQEDGSMQAVVADADVAVSVVLTDDVQAEVEDAGVTAGLEGENIETEVKCP